MARVRAQGRRIRGSALEIRTVATTVTTATPATPARVGIIVPRHSHTAVERNLVKRRLREIVRTEGLFSASVGAMVVFALPGAYRASFDALRIELTALCRRAVP